MVTQSQATSQRTKYAWTDTREQVWIDCLLDAVQQGKRTDTGWKPIVASEAIDVFRSKGFPKITKSQLDSKRDTVYTSIYRARSILMGCIVESKLEDLQRSIDYNRVWV